MNILSGMVLLGSPSSLRETSGALYAFNVPVVSVTSKEDNGGKDGDARDEVAEMLGKYDNLLTTVPDRAGQIRVRDSRNLMFPEGKIP